MTTKMFLTSVAAVMLAMPAMAEATREDWPSNDIMLENKIYTDAATEEHMLVSDDGATANATADYEAQKYSAAPGRYIPANLEYGAEDTTAECTAGNYCPGVEDVEYKSTAQGINACPDGYGTSAAGASSNTQCYRTCDINNMGTSFTNIAHATAVSGNDYYGAGADTCEPMDCENGWHVKAGTTAPDLKSLIGVTEAGNGYTSNDSTGAEYDTDNMSNSIIGGDKMAFAVDYGAKGIIKGHGRCSTQKPADFWYDNNNTFTSDHFVSTLENETGKSGAQYCYCNLENYSVNGQSQALSSSWVFGSNLGSAVDCASYCASNCGNYLQLGSASSLAFRAAVFDSINTSLASCEANTININWGGENGDTYQSTTVSYGGDIVTPFEAQKVQGCSQ